MGECRAATAAATGKKEKQNQYRIAYPEREEGFCQAKRFSPSSKITIDSQPRMDP